MGTTTFNQLIGMTSCLNELLQYKILLLIIIYSYSRTQSALKKRQTSNSTQKLGNYWIG